MAGAKGAKPVSQCLGRDVQLPGGFGWTERFGQGYGLRLEVVHLAATGRALHENLQLAIKVSLPGFRSCTAGSKPL